MGKRKPAKEPERGEWVVRLEVTRVIEICCEDCTEDEASNNPFTHQVGGETDVDQRDWEVESVEPNE